MILQDRAQTALWLGAGLLLLWLLAQLSPILSPFVLAAILAYICNPLVDRLDHAGLPRLLGVTLVVLLLGGALAALLFILLPLVTEEARIVAERLPQAAALANEKLLPWLREHYGVRIKLDATSLGRLATENKDALQLLAGKLLESLKIGGVVLFGIVANLLLAPVVLFYLLADWHALLARVGNALPRPWHGTATRLTTAVDSVLGEFLRGQLMVMAILAVYYSVALWLADLSAALPVGLLTGLLIFIPYIGYATGLVLALLAATLQFQGWGPVVGVLVVYGIGQMLESFLLTPFLVGERIGLHPLAVIFALMAFGQLFGFLGVLIALPASAALLVGLRELRRLYLASRFYQGAP